MIAGHRPRIVGICSFLAVLVAIPFARYPSYVGVDWSTYRRGLADLLNGSPLYRPELALGPYDYLSPVFANAFNMPPWFVPATLPVVLLPDSVERPIWLLLVAAMLVMAFALVLPRRDRVLWAGLAACASFVWMTLAWGNASALVALGIAIWAAGWRLGSPRMRVVGLLLASVKIVPAVPLAIYELQMRQWRAVAWSAALVGATVAVLTVATGANVLFDFAVAFANIRQVTDTNLAPSSLLSSVVPGVDASLLVRLAAVVTLAGLAAKPASLYRVAAMELVVCALVQNVFSFWLLHPLVAALAAVRADEESEPIESGAALVTT